MHRIDIRRLDTDIHNVGLAQPSHRIREHRTTRRRFDTRRDNSHIPDCRRPRAVHGAHGYVLVRPRPRARPHREAATHRTDIRPPNADIHSLGRARPSRPTREHRTTRRRFDTRRDNSHIPVYRRPRAVHGTHGHVLVRHRPRARLHREPATHRTGTRHPNADIDNVCLARPSRPREHRTRRRRSGTHDNDILRPGAIAEGQGRPCTRGPARAYPDGQRAELPSNPLAFVMSSHARDRTQPTGPNSPLRPGISVDLLITAPLWTTPSAKP